eukprot:g10587.t1
MIIMSSRRAKLRALAACYRTKRSERGSCATAVLQGDIYAIGRACSADSWRRFGCAAVSLANKIYMLGASCSFGGHLNSVQAFDTETKRWTAVAPMAWKRHRCEAAMLDGAPYAIDG